MIVHKSELINVISAQEKITKIAAEKVINNVLQAISNELRAGNTVQLHGFGTFEIRECAARIGRNPHTKEIIEIPASKKIAFKPAKALKEDL